MDPAPARIDVSIVLPVFNEAGHIVEEVDRIRAAMDRSEYSYEIIVVDDGSTDGSAEIVAGLDGVRAVGFQQNRGSGSARKYGTLLARGDVVVWTDVDMSYPNDTIPALLDQMDGVDQVVGARTSEEGTLRFLRTPAKWLIRRLASYLAGVKIPDLNSGFRAFRREVGLQFVHLLPPGFSCVTTITMTFLTNGYTVRYIPIEYATRRGSSKFHWLRDTRRYMLQVVRMTLMYSPLRVFGPPAVVVGLVAVGKLVYDLFDKNFRVGSNTMVLLGLAATLMLVGMVADLLVQLNRRRHDVIPATTFETGPER